MTSKARLKRSLPFYIFSFVFYFCLKTTQIILHTSEVCQKYIFLKVSGIIARMQGFLLFKENWLRGWSQT